MAIGLSAGAQPRVSAEMAGCCSARSGVWRSRLWLLALVAVIVAVLAAGCVGAIGADISVVPQ
jgi:hypothetical protein